MSEHDFVKLTNAVYKILDFLPDSDPLKNKAKEKALAVLENLTLMQGLPAQAGWVSLKTLLSQDSQKILLMLVADIGILQNYLSIGKGQGWIDAMNFLILTKEYRDIQIQLSKNIVKEGNEVIVPPKTQTVKKDIVQKIKKQEPVKYTQRQDKILHILYKQKKAQVGDLIKELPNITKRTVRRDLDELLKRGEIVRIGDWNQASYQLSDRT